VDSDLKHMSCCNNESKSINESVGERGLASFFEEFPVQITAAIDIRCRPPQPGVNCVVIRSIVTVFADRDEDPAEIEDLVVNGLLLSFSDGSFQDALPN